MGFAQEGTWNISSQLPVVSGQWSVISDQWPVVRSRSKSSTAGFAENCHGERNAWYVLCIRIRREGSAGVLAGCRERILRSQSRVQKKKRGNFPRPKFPD